MEIVFILLLGLMAFYVLPASLRIWRPFLIIWAIAGIAVAGLWANTVLNPYVPSGPQDWGGSFQSFLYRFFTVCWLMAGLVQGVRGAVRAKGHSGYRHWLMVVLGGLCASIISIGFFD